MKSKRNLIQHLGAVHQLVEVYLQGVLADAMPEAVPEVVPDAVPDAVPEAEEGSDTKGSAALLNADLEIKKEAALKKAVKNEEMLDFDLD